MNEKKLSRRERERLARRNDILAAARKVVAAKGYDRATLDEIAHEAEFAKGT
ncbi:MAG: TetR family transcriptional regulator, partial [bacterium]|nr:TetR family transcriptional regulator [bacterium]